MRRLFSIRWLSIIHYHSYLLHFLIIHFSKQSVSPCTDTYIIGGISIFFLHLIVQDVLFSPVRFKRSCFAWLHLPNKLFVAMNIYGCKVSLKGWKKCSFSFSASSNKMLNIFVTRVVGGHKKFEGRILNKEIFRGRVMNFF